MILQKSTIANTIRTNTKPRVFLLICFLFMVMAMLPLRAHATINCTIKNLKKGKTYYFRIRTYSLVTNKENGKETTVYGKWSGKKKVKIKK
jgi:hypothetical protein